ncbi:hypothetical protein OF83DRAFT_259608 [Amylostereum chailletii]|nr:hypothetical protein OF83DRAFT_259608 [Amylostereum chailletii]
MDLEDGDASAFHAACREARLKPTFHPFWEDLPLTNIFVSVTPDILHQLYQGVVKHVVSWIQEPGVFGTDKIDAHCRRMPPNHHTQLFTSSISSLSRITGSEHKDICRILMGLIVDLPLPNGLDPAQLVHAVRTLLDFLHIAQFPSHTGETLDSLDDTLRRFHDNKQIFANLSVREHFNLPKIHSMCHYRPSIELFGTTDNYNTEQSERLHINFTKDAYRASNHKDEYPQMTTWLKRREKMQRHSAFIQWRLSEHPGASDVPEPISETRLRVQLTKEPTHKVVSLDTLSDEYGAVDFSDALADFVTRHNNPSLGPAAARHVADNTRIPTRSVAVYHRIKFWNHDELGRDFGLEEDDAIHVRPSRTDTLGRHVPGRFDTVLVKTRSGSAGGAGANKSRKCASSSRLQPGQHFSSMLTRGRMQIHPNISHMSSGLLHSQGHPIRTMARTRYLAPCGTRGERRR